MEAGVVAPVGGVEADFRHHGDDAPQTTTKSRSGGRGSHGSASWLWPRLLASNVAAFDRERRRWLAAVAQDHRQGVVRFGVFGTPTLVLEEGEVVFVKVARIPSEDRSSGCGRGLRTVAQCFPELVEIKRPLALPPPPRR